MYTNLPIYIILDSLDLRQLFQGNQRLPLLKTMERFSLTVCMDMPSTMGPTSHLEPLAPIAIQILNNDLIILSNVSKEIKLTEPAIPETHKAGSLPSSPGPCFCASCQFLEVLCHATHLLQNGQRYIKCLPHKSINNLGSTVFQASPVYLCFSEHGCYTKQEENHSALLLW